MEDQKIFEEILRLKQTREPAALAMVVESSGSSPRKAGAKMLVRGDGTTCGTVGGGKIEAETIREALEVLAQGSPRTLPFSLTEEQGMICGGQVLVYVEPVSLPPHLLIIGSGHVGQALARSAGPPGFQVTLVDPNQQESAARVTGFAPSDLVCTVAELFDQVTIDPMTYILIATRGHHDDFVAVQAALGTRACYIGLIGSRRKRDHLKTFLTGQGLPPSAFERVITPVGLDIGAQTPEEIAVSITAQLIQWRRTHALSGFSHTAGCGALAEDGPAQTAAAAR